MLASGLSEALLLASLLLAAGAAPTSTEDAWTPRTTPDPLQGELSFLGALGKRQASLAGVQPPVLNAQGCYPAGTTALQMNVVYSQGGPNAQVVLCPNTTYELNNTIIFTAAGQGLSTLGYPTDASRAIMTVTNSVMSVALYGACNSCSNTMVRSVQIDGNRAGLGIMSGGSALIEMGGISSGQTVRDSHLWDPRGWSCLHIIEGTNLLCRNATILNNQVGPSGNSPNTAQQFRKRANVAPGQWADGISNGCGSSLITGNVVTDATDGGIVVFGAAGSQIVNNTVMTVNSVLLGGINMVDVAGWGGNYTGTVVANNTLMTTAGSMIKIGLPIGTNNWSGINNTSWRTYNGQVLNNRLVSNTGGYFGYGISVTGHNNSYVANNDISQASFGGIPSQFCVTGAVPPQTLSPGIFYDPTTSYGVWTGQTNAIQTTLQFLICIMENAYGTYSAWSALPPMTATTTTSAGASIAGRAAATATAPAKVTSGKTGRLPQMPPSGPKIVSSPAAAAPLAPARGGKAVSRRAHVRDFLLPEPTDGPSPFAKEDVLDSFRDDDVVVRR